MEDQTTVTLNAQELNFLISKLPGTWEQDVPQEVHALSSKLLNALGKLGPM
jgi:hypothetical protein